MADDTNKIGVQIFDLIKRHEFLYLNGAENIVANGVGEVRNKKDNKMYGAIKVDADVEAGGYYFENEIIDSNALVYCTQASNTKEQAKEVAEKLLSGETILYLGIRFPHMKYEDTSYFNFGDVVPVKIDGPYKKEGKERYYYRITCNVEGEIPKELLMYK